MGNARYVGQRSDRRRAPGLSQPSDRVGAHHKGVPAFSRGTSTPPINHARSTPSRDARRRAR
eukprot:581384-Prymnesium_polylepis.1